MLEQQQRVTYLSRLARVADAFLELVCFAVIEPPQLDNRAFPSLVAHSHFSLLSAREREWSFKQRLDPGQELGSVGAVKDAVVAGQC